MPMTHAPETGARKLASVSGVSVIQFGAEFFWRQILESDRTVLYFAIESGDHVIKILICDWSVINVVVVFVCWSCKFCLYSRLLKLFNLFNLFSLFNMSWTHSQIESLIAFYSSMLDSGARNFATGVKNRRQKLTPVFWRRFLERVSWALDGIQIPTREGAILRLTGAPAKDMPGRRMVDILKAIQQGVAPIWCGCQWGCTRCGHIGATCRIRLNRPCVAAMQPYVKLL